MLTEHTVHCIKNSVFSSNTYIVSAIDSGQSLIIDPGLDTAAIDSVIEANKLKPALILATHGHFDHVGSVAYFQRKYAAEFYIHQRDIKALRSVNFFLKVLKISSGIEIPVPDHVISEPSATIDTGHFTISVHNLPGHTDGSCTFLIGSSLFTGDTLYAAGIGTNHFPGSNKEQLKSSVRKIFDSFDPSVTAYPGHGAFEKLGTIQETNTALKQFLESNVEI